MNTNAKALDAFIARKTVIDAMLARLAALSDEHFGLANAWTLSNKTSGIRNGILLT